MTKPVTATFRRTLAAMKEKKKLVPVLRAMAADIHMKPFTLDIEGPTRRGYDGWFHPSSQATWTVRQLYYYLASPEMLEDEDLDISSVFAISQGHFFHAMIQNLLLSNGVLKASEVPLVDKTINVRGHMDGDLGDEGLEIKTMNRHTIAKIDDAEDIRLLKPEYYGQAQDYLAISGKKGMRFVIMQTDWPFDMIEVYVPRDEAYIAAQRAKYREAIEAAAEGKVPAPCEGCGIGTAMSKSCPVRRACPLGAKR